MEQKPAKKITVEQRKVMLEFLQANKWLCTNKFNGPNGQHEKEHLWYELADKLNSVAGGVTKNWRQWQKSWQDWRCDTRKKVLEIKAANEAGGLCSRRISNVEEQLLTLIGWESADGHKESKDPTEENSRPEDGSILLPIIFAEEEPFTSTKRRKVSESKCINCTSKEDDILQASLTCSERMATAMERQSTALERMATALEKQGATLQRQTATLQQMCSSVELVLQKFSQN